MRVLLYRGRGSLFSLIIPRDAAVRASLFNGSSGVLVEMRSLPKERLAPRTVMTLDLDAAGRISHIYVVSATLKLTAVDRQREASAERQITPGTSR